MRKRTALLPLLILPILIAGRAAVAENLTPAMPKDARQIFAVAAPLYNFNDPAIQPFHLKASYQLYDEKGQPSEQGTYEYWWASPTVWRSSWTRPGATHTDWHTADGRVAHETTGETLKYFEYKLQSALFSPLPDESELNQRGVYLKKLSISSGDEKFECIMLEPQMEVIDRTGKVANPSLGLFPTYCFDSKIPALMTTTAFGSVTTAFKKISVVRGKYMARQIELLEGKKPILNASVDSITELSPADQALTPSPAALAASTSATKAVEIAASVAKANLIKQYAPAYPQDALEGRVSGTVVLQAIIGTDGGVHDLRVLSTPWPSLAAAALWSVSHWQYKPYLLNGRPVEIKTKINVDFAFGQTQSFN